MFSDGKDMIGRLKRKEETLERYRRAEFTFSSGIASHYNPRAGGKRHKGRNPTLGTSHERERFHKLKFSSIAVIFPKGMGYLWILMER